MESNALAGYWWKEVTSACNFVIETVNALRGGKVPVLLVPNDLPWREAMRFVMQEHIADVCEVEGTYTIDVRDDNTENLAPGRFMLRKLRDTTYRTGSHLTVQQHILNNGLLTGKMFWIKGLSAGNADQWLDFCNGFQIDRRNKGVIVVEMPFDKDLSGYENLKAIQYEQIIREYGVQLFVEYVLDDAGYSKNWRRYLSILVSTLCQKDVEVACDLVKEQNLKVTRIDEALRKIAASAGYARRGDAEDHILNMVRKGKKEKIDRLVWTAQMQVLFPMLEMERVRWVERYRAQIQEALSKNFVTMVGGDDRVLDPNDVEIKHIRAFYHNRNLDANIVPKRKNRLDVLYECRNSLAHLRPCSHEWVQALLDTDFEDLFS